MQRLPDDVLEVMSGPARPALTPRELEAVRLLARRMSTTQIAADMSISVNTVRTRVRRAVRKLGTDTRERAVQTARDRGLVERAPLA